MDIIERLRRNALVWGEDDGADIYDEAADTIALLRADLARADADARRWRAEVDDAKHAMRAYARENQYRGQTQDPNGVRAWLERNDAAIAAQGADRG